MRTLRETRIVLGKTKINSPTYGQKFECRKKSGKNREYERGRPGKIEVRTATLYRSCWRWRWGLVSGQNLCSYCWGCCGDKGRNRNEHSRRNRRFNGRPHAASRCDSARCQRWRYRGFDTKPCFKRIRNLSYRAGVPGNDLFYLDQSQR